MPLSTTLYISEVTLCQANTKSMLWVRSNNKKNKSPIVCVCVYFIYVKQRIAPETQSRVVYELFQHTSLWLCVCVNRACARRDYVNSLARDAFSPKIMHAKIPTQHKVLCALWIHVRKRAAPTSTKRHILNLCISIYIVCWKKRAICMGWIRKSIFRVMCVRGLWKGVMCRTCERKHNNNQAKMKSALKCRNNLHYYGCK